MSNRRTIPATVFAILIVLALSVLIPYAIVVSFLAERRRHRDAERSRCVTCGRILGAQSLKRSNEYWREYVRQLHLSHLGVKFRLVRTNWAICANCGAAYTYAASTRTFESTELEPLPTADGAVTSGIDTSKR